MDEHVRWVTKAEAAREMEISLSTLDRRIRSGEVEVVREGRRVYVRMHGLEYVGDDDLLRRSLGREDKLQRTIWELDRTVTESERKRDVAREAALASRQAHKELEEAYRKETAAHKETKESAQHGPRDRHRAVRAAGRQRSRVVVCAEIGAPPPALRRSCQPGPPVLPTPSASLTRRCSTFPNANP